MFLKKNISTDNASTSLLAWTLALTPLVAFHGKILVTYLPLITLILFFLLKPPTTWLILKNAFFKLRFLIIGLAGFIFYLVINTCFITDHNFAPSRLEKLLALFPLAILFLSSIHHIKFNLKQTTRLLNSIMGLSVLCSVLIFWQYNTQLFYFAWINNINEIAQIPKASYNTSSVLIIIMGYTAFLMQTPKKHYHFLTPITLTILAYFGTESQASQILVILIPSIYLSVQYFTRYRWSLATISILTCVIMLIKPLLIIYSFEHITIRSFLANSEFLKSGYAINRLEIWYLISEKVSQAPLFGYGLNATESFTNLNKVSKYNQAMPISHPHDYMLQSWLDLGIIGVAFILALKAYLSVIIHKVRNMCRRQASICMTSFLALMWVYSISYDMWQGFWLSFIFIMTALHMIVFQAKESKND